MIRWLRVPFGYTQGDPATTPGRLMPEGFHPLDDMNLQVPEPGEPDDGIHGHGGSSNNGTSGQVPGEQ